MFKHVLVLDVCPAVHGARCVVLVVSGFIGTVEPHVIVDFPLQVALPTVLGTQHELVRAISVLMVHAQVKFEMHVASSMTAGHDPSRALVGQVLRDGHGEHSQTNGTLTFRLLLLFPRPGARIRHGGFAVTRVDSLKYVGGDEDGCHDVSWIAPALVGTTHDAMRTSLFEMLVQLVRPQIAIVAHTTLM